MARSERILLKIKPMLDEIDIWVQGLSKADKEKYKERTLEEPTYIKDLRKSINYIQVNEP